MKASCDQLVMHIAAVQKSIVVCFIAVSGCISSVGPDKDTVNIVLPAGIQAGTPLTFFFVAGFSIEADCDSVVSAGS